MTMQGTHGEHHHHGLMTPQRPGPVYNFMKGGIVIGGVLGFISFMAYANTFTNAVFSLFFICGGGAIAGVIVLGFLGWIVDVVRHRRGKELS